MKEKNNEIFELEDLATGIIYNTTKEFLTILKSTEGGQKVTEKFLKKFIKELQSFKKALNKYHKNYSFNNSIIVESYIKRVTNNYALYGALLYHRSDLVSSYNKNEINKKFNDLKKLTIDENNRMKHFDFINDHIN